MSDIPDNVKQHRQYHDKRVNGLRAPALKSDIIIWNDRDFRVTVVTPISPRIQQIRASEIGRISQHDTGYDFTPWEVGMPNDESSFHAFLLYKENRGIGLLVTETCTQIWKAYWTETAWKTSDILRDQPPMWSITMIWLLEKYRGAGLAQRLVDEALTYLDRSIESVGWYIPEVTPSGHAFIKKYCPEWFYIAK